VQANLKLHKDLHDALEIIKDINKSNTENSNSSDKHTRPTCSHMLTAKKIFPFTSLFYALYKF
jgi:hypothetical protein